MMSLLCNFLLNISITLHSILIFFYRLLHSIFCHACNCLIFSNNIFRSSCRFRHVICHIINFADNAYFIVLSVFKIISNRVQFHRLLPWKLQPCSFSVPVWQVLQGSGEGLGRNKLYYYGSPMEKDSQKIGPWDKCLIGFFRWVTGIRLFNPSIYKFRSNNETKRSNKVVNIYDSKRVTRNR